MKLFSRLYDPNNYSNGILNRPLKFIHRNFERILRKIVEYKFGKSNYVLIITTMRSGSSLLNHILAQNKRFISIGESHTNYHNSRDLKTLMLKSIYYYKWAIFSNRTYIDKCVQNHQINTSNFLNFYRIKKIIFLIRDPIETISSLLDTTFPYSDNLRTASKYYKDRLDHILKLAKCIQKPEKGIVITYYDLINKSNATLDVLSKFLELNQPLSTSYNTQKWSSEWGKGDVGSIKINTGKIDNTPRKKIVKMHWKTSNGLEILYTKTIQSLQAKFQSIT